MILSVPTMIGFISGMFFTAVLRLGFSGFIAGYFLGSGLSRYLIRKAQEAAVIRQSRERYQHHADAAQDANRLFFATTFEVLGHISKAKGVVTKTDIELANAVMDQMSLSGEARHEAQVAFVMGKSQDYPLRGRLRDFFRHYQYEPDLLFFFMEIQIQGAFSDGSIHEAERAILSVIAEELHISRAVFNRYMEMMESNQRFYRGNASGQNEQREQYYSSSYDDRRGYSPLQDAFKVLGVSETAEGSVIKRAYRKLMNEHHPDKLVAKGLPPEMLELAKRRTQEIQAAYDLIKQHKGFK